MACFCVLFNYQPTRPQATLKHVPLFTTQFLQEIDGLQCTHSSRNIDYDTIASFSGNSWTYVLFKNK